MLAVVAVAGVVLGALYMLRFALAFLYGAAKAPHQPFADLDRREKAILGLIVAAVFALGLFPDEPMRKTELAAKAYQQLVTTSRLPAAEPPGEAKRAMIGCPDRPRPRCCPSTCCCSASSA